jgi:hypothetical protein
LGIYIGMEGLVSELPRYPNVHPHLWNSDLPRSQCRHPPPCCSRALRALTVFPRHHPVVAVLFVPSPSSHAAAAVAALHDAHIAIGSILSHLDSAVASYGDDQSMMEDAGRKRIRWSGRWRGSRMCPLGGTKRWKRTIGRAWRRRPRRLSSTVASTSEVV